MSPDSRLFCLLHPNSEKPWTGTQRHKVDKRDKKRRDIGSIIREQVQNEKGEGERWRKHTKKKNTKKGTKGDFALQRLENKRRAAATHQHTEGECKSALMLMSYILQCKTDCLYTQQHTSLCYQTAQLPSGSVQKHVQETKSNHKRQHLFPRNKRLGYSGLHARTHTLNYLLVRHGLC